MLDSAKIQEEDAENANRHHYTKHHPAKPLYTFAEARRCFNYFRTEDDDTHLELNEHINFRFKLSGHILGACSIEITCYGKTIIFSGDLGRKHSPILADPVKLAQADYIIMESTYGDRIHSNNDPYTDLETWINRTLENSGQIIIPSFAVGRAQELLYIIHTLKSQNRIPLNLPVIMDSPMAASATEIMLNYADEFTEVSAKKWRELLARVKVNVEYTQTLRTLKDDRSKIIIAASGMLSGGRVLEYLKHYISDSKNSGILIGFQAEGTRGRALLNGTHELKIHGQYFPVRAKVAEIFGLSAHADQTELMRWVTAIGVRAKQIFLVHGEATAQQTLRVKIQTELGFPVTIAKQGEDHVLFTCGALASSTKPINHNKGQDEQHNVI